MQSISQLMEKNTLAFITLLFVLIGLFLYFLPSIIARKKRDALSIFLLNLFLGATGIGWVIALVWACKKDYEPTIIYVEKNQQPALNPAEIHNSDIPMGNEIVEQNYKSRFYWDIIVLLIVLSATLLFGYKFYKNRVQGESQQIGSVANNWSETDKIGFAESTNEFIDKYDRNDIKLKRVEISNCIIEETISRYPAFEDFKREFVNDRNIIMEIISTCLTKYGLQDLN